MKPKTPFDPAGARRAGLSKNERYRLEGTEAVCPYCGRRTDLVSGRDGFGDPRGEGFRKAGFSRHVYACYEKKLATFGCQLGVWDAALGRHELAPLHR